MEFKKAAIYAAIIFVAILGAWVVTNHLERRQFDDMIGEEEA